MDREKLVDQIKERFIAKFIKNNIKSKKLEVIATLVTECEENGLAAYAFCFRGYAEWERKEYDNAISCFNKAIEKDPDFAFPYNGLGNVYYKSKKEYDKAIEWYQKAIEKDPDFAAPYANLGLVYDNKKEYDKAIEWYQKAIEKDPDFAAPYNGLGNVYYNKKEYDKAIEWYQKAIEKDPDDASTYNNLGITYEYKNDFVKAREYYLKALSLYKEQNDQTRTSIVEQRLKTIDDLANALKKVKEEAYHDPMAEILEQTKEMGEDVEEKKKTFYEFLKQSSVSKEGNYIKVLRRWNSYTPIIGDNYHISKGGGYFLKIGGKGVVIDPGFNFIDNFKGAGHQFNEIDAVFVSHAHNDHTSDLESILTLLNEYNEKIKGLDITSDEDTVRFDLAQRDGKKVSDVDPEEIEKEFKKSTRRKLIDIYITKSVHVKFSGMARLDSKENHNLHIIEAGKSLIECRDNKDGAYLSFKVIKAKHNDIISDRDSVGLVFYLRDSVLIYTGDTGWNAEIEKQYAELKEELKEKRVILIAHIGGFKKNEMKYFDIGDDAFYDNHLGRLGLVKLAMTLKPAICFISEFGEEFKNHRIRLTEIFGKVLPTIRFFPADIGLEYDFREGKIKAITSIDLDKFVIAEERYVEPSEIEICLLRKDYSLHYYKKDHGFTQADLIQVLIEDYDRRTIYPHNSAPG